MSRIDDLIAELCPDGVPLRKLGEVGEFVRGRRFTKLDYVESGLGAIHYGEIYTDYGTVASRTRSFVRADLRSSLRLAHTGDLVIAATGENLKDVCKAVAWLGDEPIAVHDDCYIFRHPLDPNYVAYCFQSSSFQAQKAKLASESKVVRVSGSNMAKITVPIPPMQVQREIAAVLDTFADLEAELEADLEAELEARRRQYEHYRDTLISSTSERVPSVRLGDVAGNGLFTDGDWVESKDQDQAGDVRLTQLADVGVGVFRNRSNRWMREDQAGKLGCTFLRPGDVLIARMPDPLGRACQVPNDIGRAVTVVDVAILRIESDSVEARYVMHALNSRMVRNAVLSFQSGGTRQRISRKNLGSVEIPLPPLDEQRRIASLLDKFDALVIDLSLDLPAELAARRRQYEHYRDRLLTFPEAA